jgi:hypothetical protein
MILSGAVRVHDTDGLLDDSPSELQQRVSIGLQFDQKPYHGNSSRIAVTTS